MQLEQVFPYRTFRLGQLELARAVFETCKRKDRLVVEAMSGFGKTAPVLSGSILAAEEDGSRIIYACRTKRQVLRVLEELRRIQEKVPVSAAALFAKVDYCLLKETSGFQVNNESFKWYCSFNTSNNLCSYFLNLTLLGEQLSNLIRSVEERVPTQAELLDRSRSVHICPYEVARLAIANSRVVVTTYHYLLDETARTLLVGTSGWEASRTIAVVDEAHNLRDFVRDLSTTSLSFNDLMRALDDARAINFAPAITYLENLEDGIRRFCIEERSWHVDRARLLSAMKGGHDDVWLASAALELSTCAGIGWYSISTGKNLPTSIMKVGSFLKDVLSSEVGFSIVKSHDTIFLVNTDSARLFGLVKDFRSLVLLSATVSPANLFLSSIGLSEHTPIHRVNVRQKFGVRTIIDVGVSTRFKLRGPENYSRIAEKLSAICRGVRGSVGVFLPSYQFLDSITPFISQMITDRPLISERRNLTNSEAETMMSSFKSRPGSLLLAVQGARFSEGEDFPGDQMDVSVVVGFSLPPPTPTMYAELANSRLNKHDAYLVISLLPAVRKAVQAAGRHIRSPEKRGMVFFMDSRFNQKNVLQMIPDWLRSDMKVGDFSSLETERMVRLFFQGSP